MTGVRMWLTDRLAYLPRLLQNKVAEPLARTAWPRRGSGNGQDPARVAIVSVNYNTVDLISYLIFSLYRVVGPSRFDRVVIVDNGSVDGSVEVLRALAERGLIEVVLNRRQRYHGPGLNQAISMLARTWRPDGPPYVWILDSDVIVLRPEAVTDAVALCRRHRAAVAGDFNDDNSVYPSLRSLMIDPEQVWRRPIPPFEEAGDPSEAMQRRLLERGLDVLRFPYFSSGYALHLGSGTLNALLERGLTANRYFGWATQWAWSYQETIAGGRSGEIFRRFTEIFQREVPEFSGPALAEACLRPHLIQV